MRSLLYVPIIHTEADLGSLAPAIGGVSASLCGEKRWAKHKETVRKFWQAVEDYLAPLNGANLKIYQDGLPAEGELGRKVVEEAAQRGSKNHQVVRQLMAKGAELRKTEDASLLIEEHALLAHLAQGKLSPKMMADYARDKSHRERLTAERDKFIAKRVNETLKEGETAILFIGAYHDVLSHLAQDIVVKPLKEREKVRAYFRELFLGRDEEGFEQLAQYLASAV